MGFPRVAALPLRLCHALRPAAQCALVVGALWLVGDVGVRKRVLKLLHQQGRTLASVRSVLLEYRGNLGDEGAPACVHRLHSHVCCLPACSQLLAPPHSPALTPRLAPAALQAALRSGRAACSV